MDATFGSRPDREELRNAIALVAVLVAVGPSLAFAASVLAPFVPGLENLTRVGFFARDPAPSNMGGYGALLGGALVGLYVRGTVGAAGASLAGAGLGYAAIVFAFVAAVGANSDDYGSVEALRQLLEWDELVGLGFSAAVVVLTAAVAAVATSELLGTVATRPVETGEPATERTRDRAWRGLHESSSIDSAMEDSESSGADGAS